MICQVSRETNSYLFVISIPFFWLTFYFVLEYTDMSMSQIMQRQSVLYSGNAVILKHLITQVAGLLETVESDKRLRAFNAIDIIIEPKIVILEVRFTSGCPFDSDFFGCITATS